MDLDATSMHGEGVQGQKKLMKKVCRREGLYYVTNIMNYTCDGNPFYAALLDVQCTLHQGEWKEEMLSGDEKTPRCWRLKSQKKITVVIILCSCNTDVQAGRPRSSHKPTRGGEKIMFQLGLLLLARINQRLFTKHICLFSHEIGILLYSDKNNKSWCSYRTKETMQTETSGGVTSHGSGQRKGWSNLRSWCPCACGARAVRAVSVATRETRCVGRSAHFSWSTRWSTRAGCAHARFRLNIRHMYVFLSR
jgi:hypothetical protein